MKKVFSKDGTPIAYDQQGTGEPLILIDGALCSRGFGPMPKLATLLAQHFTVINYDRRGRGESGDTNPYSVEKEVDDIGALIKAAGAPVYLFGISSGAVLAFEAAVHELNIKKVAMYEPPFAADKTTGHQAPTDSAEQLAAFISAGRRSDAVKFFMQDMVGMPRVIVSIMKLLPVWKKLKAVAHTLPYDAAVVGTQPVPVQKAAAIKIPAMVMNGGKTAPELSLAAKSLAGAIPNAAYQSVPGQTHNVAPNVIAPLLVEYFKSV